MNTWLFIKAREEGRSLWVELKNTKSKPVCGFSIPIEDLKYLLKHFRAKSTFHITNKSFNSTQDDPILALKILIIEIKLGKKYRKPTPNKIFDTCAIALAELTEPDLSLFDPDSIHKAFASIWTQEYYRPNTDWLAGFNLKVQKLSKKTVKIENTKVPKKYLPGVLGPYCCLDLVSIYGRRITFIIGPYSTPIDFIKIKHPNQK